VKFSFTCMNAYRTDAALERIFTATPRALWDPESGKRMMSEALELSALADEVGFDFVSVSEHHYQAGMCNPNPAVIAGALTQVVKRARIALLGPLVSINNPVRIAEEIAMLDQMSGGRLIALPLRGTPNEFAIYEGVAAEETRGLTEEGMLVIKKALTEPEPFSWSVEHYEFPEVSVWPGPTQVPHPPLYYSANSPESAEFAAEHQFGAAISYLGVKAVAERMQYYRDQCDARGWVPAPEQTLFRAFCIVGEDEAHAADLKQRFYGPKPRPSLGPPAAQNVDAGYAFGMLQFAGDVDGVVEQIREHHALTGVGIYDLSFNFGYYSFEEGMDQVSRFAREVMPQVRDLAAVAA
jgi:alkanesulfonate monooxygenase SsuD/methylene tetrahydromethanopterin reductase-like flavin-dependent oxidoreductase (luciferase family)